MKTDLEGRIAADTRLECRICWWVYDPEAGDPGAGIPPGTPFSRLPEDWRCPRCDGDPEGFLPIDDA